MDPTTNIVGGHNCTYSTIDDEIRLLITNKKHLKNELEFFFGTTDVNKVAQFDKKVGNLNQYIITPNGPICYHDASNYIAEHDELDYFEVYKVHRLKVLNSEISNKRHRSRLLSEWVLQGANPSQFLRLLDLHFMTIAGDDGYSVIVPKNNSAVNDKVACDASTSDNN